MYIDNIYLTNFRNYKNLKLKFTQGINIIVGNNGVGKTNILESLLVLSNTKSFRVTNDNAMIKHDEDFARIETFFENKRYKIVINQKNKHYFIDGNEVKNQKFIGNINCVLFEPSDINIFKDNPKKRRRLLDIEISKISKEYLYYSYVYFKLLREKNTLLKHSAVDYLLLDTIDDSLIKPIQIIVKHRKSFIDFINENIGKYYKTLSATDADISIKYECCIENSDEEFIKNKLKKYRKKDVLYQSGYIGIHKEDFKFYYNKQELNKVASQGQKKMVMVAFKLALVEYIKNCNNDTPILLLDDILSELDLNNQKRLIKFLDGSMQTIITSTDVNGLKLKQNYRLIEIK